MNTIELCPILHPTYEQFKNFNEYVAKVEQEHRGRYGMVKIVPPKQWVSRSKKYNQILKNLKITKPEYQTLYGQNNSFYFSCKNQRHPEMTLEQYKKVAFKKQNEISKHTSQSAIEEYFWQHLNTLNNELYGANVQLSLMDKDAGQWDFSNLQSFFSDIVTEKIHGLNTSFLFVGAWRTFFNWHIEDLDLSAINLLHEGKPKMWYAIHPQHRKRFQEILADLFKQEFFQCPNFMRHKQMFVNPYKLKQKYPFLKISKMYQNEGEISLAFAQAYHSGFNMGFNIAEAVNYGTIDWLERYCKFKGCKCPLKIGVELCHEQMIENIKKTPYYNKLRDTTRFQQFQKKIEERVSKEDLPNRLFLEANSQEIEKEVQKIKEKPINKGKKKVFVPKYNRYFTVDKPSFIQCDSCKKWRKVSAEVTQKYKDKKKVTCTQIGFTCKPSKSIQRKSKNNE